MGLGAAERAYLETLPHCNLCYGSGKVDSGHICRCHSVCTCTWEADCPRCGGTGRRLPR